MLRAKLGLTRSNQVTEMLRTSVPLCVVAALFIIAATGCEKNSGEAVVLAKEHIDAARPSAETPNGNPRLAQMHRFVPWRMTRSQLMAT
jgi:hypothetical protein